MCSLILSLFYNIMYHRLPLSLLPFTIPAISLYDLSSSCNRNISLSYFFVSHFLVFILNTTYGIQLWGTASNSNIEILQRFQSKMLRSLINAPWYVTNETIHRNLKIPTVKEEIYKFRSRYNARVNNHHNPLVTQLLETTDQIRRLKRKYSLDWSIRSY